MWSAPSRLGLAFALSLAAALPLAACSSTTTSVEGAPSPDGGAGAEGGAGEDAGEPLPFALTSSAFEEGDTLPEAHTCDATSPGSPPLEWTAGPEGTKSYALVFTDTTNGLVHSVIYDIPADTTSLPAKVENTYEPSEVAGAKQTTGYDNKTFGYLGPCPPSGEHVYEFALYALDVDALPGAKQATTRAEAVTAIKKADLAVTKLTAKYKKK